MSLPAPWPRSEVSLPDRTMAVRHAPGPVENPAVFVHGLGGTSLNWTDLMHLMQGDTDGWAVDLNGFGVSPPPRDGDSSPQGHARGIAAFVEQEIGAPVHLFGNSLGGAIALQLAARRPDLVRSLTLTSPALPSARATRANVTLPLFAVPGFGEQAMQRYQQVPARQRVQGTIDLCFAEPERVPDQRIDEAVADQEQRDYLPYATDEFLRSLRGLLRTFVDFGPERPWKLAEQVQCRTLLVYGRQDPLVDSIAAHKATKYFRQAEVLVLPGAAHVAQIEQPELVYAAWSRWCR